MIFAAISDIHGNIDALDAVLADIGRRGIDRIVNLGDCLSGPFDARATADRLMALGLPTVRGNHDRAFWDTGRDGLGPWERWGIDSLEPRHLDWLRSFPETIEYEGALLCHGTPFADDENWLDHRTTLNRLVARDRHEVEARAGETPHPLILCGHTHTPRMVRISGGRSVVNPGSVGCPAYLDDRTDPAFIHQTGAPDARYAILERKEDGWRADLVAVAYDAARMAAMARHNGATSWAQAVETGWITPP